MKIPLDENASTGKYYSVWRKQIRGNIQNLKIPSFIAMNYFYIKLNVKK